MGERAGLLDRGPDGHPDDEQGGDRGAQLPEAHGAPDEEGEHQVGVLELAPEHEVGHGGKSEEEDAGFRRSAPARPAGPAEAEEEGGEDQDPRRVPRPPHRPDGGQAIGGDGAGEPKRTRPEAGAHGHGEEGSEKHDGQRVAQAVELPAEARRLKQVGGEQRGEGVSGGDRRRGEERGSDRNVDQKSRQSDCRPHARSKPEKGHEGDPGRRPDGGDDPIDEGELEAQPCGEVIGEPQEQQPAAVRTGPGGRPNPGHGTSSPRVRIVVGHIEHHKGRSR